MPPPSKTPSKQATQERARQQEGKTPEPIVILDDSEGEEGEVQPKRKKLKETEKEKEKEEEFYRLRNPHFPWVRMPGYEFERCGH